MLAWPTKLPRFRVPMQATRGYSIPHYLAKTVALKLLNSKNGENLSLVFGNEAGVYGLL
jgi:hypothetical protein